MTSIRKRLTRELCLGVGLMLLAGLSMLYLGLRRMLERQFDETLVAVCRDVESDLRRGEKPLAERQEGGILSHRERRTPRYYVLVFDDSKKVLYSDGWTAPPSFSPGSGHHGRIAFGDVVLPGGRPGRAAVTDVPDLAGSGALALAVAAERHPLDHALGAVLSGIVTVGVALLAITVSIVLLSLRSELRPLDALAVEASKIDAGSLDRRFAVGGLPAELRPIAERLNDLLARLESSFARERRVNADLAHELRTPLSELRVLAESALKWPESRDKAHDDDVLEIAKHMESLIERMLAIARSEEDRLAIRTERVEVSALLGETWERYSRRAEARGLSNKISLEPASAVADPVLLRSILTNLVENAVDYATDRGSLSLACRPVGHGVVIVEIANTAAELSRDEVSLLFERYWRKDAARSVGTHFGLGLALCKRFSEAMGWSVTAELTPQGALVILLKSPQVRI